MICKLENYGLFLEGDLLFPRLIVFWTGVLGGLKFIF
jgi:hypothetical protein